MYKIISLKILIYCLKITWNHDFRALFSLSGHSTFEKIASILNKSEIYIQAQNLVLTVHKK